MPEDENGESVPRAEQPFKRRGQAAARARNAQLLTRAGQRASRIGASYRAGQSVKEIANRHRVSVDAVRRTLEDVLGHDCEARVGRALIRRQEARSQESAEATAAVAEKARQRLEAMRHTGAGPRPRHIRWTPDAVLGAIRKFDRSHGRSPRRADFDSGRRARYPSPARVVQVFGSWRAAIAVAGLPVPSVTAGTAPRWSDEAILDAIRNADREGLRTSIAYRKARRRPSLGTIVTRFGSWTRARELALCGDQEESRGPRRISSIAAYRTSAVPMTTERATTSLHQGAMLEALTVTWMTAEALVAIGR